MFKKKALNFTYEKVSRKMRHAETVKIRESSRFKRLSMIRSINDSDLAEKSSAEIKMTETIECKERVASSTVTSSRLEMLFKWKQEKQLKKEMEKKNEKKPFYAGKNQNVFDCKNFKSSFIAQPNSSFNTSKFVKSKIFASSNSLEKNKVQNAKQGSSGSTIPLSKVLKPKQGVLTPTSQPSRIPNSKQTSSLQKSDSTAIASKKLPTPALRKLPTPALRKLPIPDTGKSSAALSRKLQTPATRIDNKTTSYSKAVNDTQKAPAKTTPNYLRSNTNVLKTKDLSKPFSKIGTGLPKPTFNAAAVSKGISVQSKMPVSSANKKFGSNLKLNQKETPQSNENVPSRKGYCFKTAISNSSRSRIQTLQKTPVTPKKLPEKITKDVKEKPSKKESPKRCFDHIPDVTFNSDISMIKPARVSFAPSNFTFQPPNGLNSFCFEEEDDEDFDIHKVFEEAKMKFMSRTSTPTKNSRRQSSMHSSSTPSKDSGGQSSIKNSRESEEGSNVRADLQKSADLSSSNDIRISELMSPEVSKDKIGNKETDETVNKQACNESCKITSVGIKDSNNPINKQACEELVCVVPPIKTEIKDTDVAANQYTCEELVSILPMKMKDIDTAANQKAFEESDSLLSIIIQTKNSDIAANQQSYEKAASISSIKIKNKDANVAASQQSSEELASISSIKIKDKYTDVAANQQSLEELTSLSSIKIEVSNTNVAANQQTCEKSASISPIKTMLVESDKIVNKEISEEIMCGVNKDAIKGKTTEKKDSDLFQSLFSEKLPFEDFDKCENIDRDAVNLSQEIINMECQFNPSPKNTVCQNTDEKEIFLDDGEDEVLDSIQLELMKLDDDSDEDILPEVFKSSEVKPNGAGLKRVSMLKSLPIMNSIAENVETDDCVSVNTTKYTPRRSKKQASQVYFNILDSDINNVDSPNSAATPRRSLRLKKMSATNDNFAVGVSEEGKSSNINPRRSMRLIDLNTPEKVPRKKLPEGNSENMDPNKLLMDLESPTTPSFPKSKKVSLLYSPEKRKSIRKSIRGDLMAFSPV